MFFKDALSFLTFGVLAAPSNLRLALMCDFRSMNRDPDVYPRPDDFLPERFLDSPGPFTSLNNIYAYGFGRRFLHPLVQLPLCKELILPVTGSALEDIWLTIPCGSLLYPFWPPSTCASQKISKGTTLPFWKITPMVSSGRLFLSLDC